MFAPHWARIVPDDGTMFDRDGPTYRWVPNLLVNALLEFWLGVSKLIRSRGRAPSAGHCLRAHPGHKNTPTGRKCSKIVTFGSFRVRQPVKDNQMHREGSELSHIPARCIAFECWQGGAVRVIFRCRRALTLCIQVFATPGRRVSAQGLFGLGV